MGLGFNTGNWHSSTHKRRSLMGYSPWSHQQSDKTERLSTAQPITSKWSLQMTELTLTESSAWSNAEILGWKARSKTCFYKALVVENSSLSTYLVWSLGDLIKHLSSFPSSYLTQDDKSRNHDLCFHIHLFDTKRRQMFLSLFSFLNLTAYLNWSF